MKLQVKKLQAGQGMLEIILAMMVFGLIAASLASLAVGGFRGLEQGGEQTQAQAIAQEGIDAVRSIRDQAFNEIIYSTSAVAISGGKWIFSGEGSTETIGKFTRTISFTNVCRNATNNIVDCPGTYTDVHSKKATITVTWTTRGGITNSVQKIAYITNWDSREWIEDTTVDFSDGIFASTATSATAGDGDGAITLAPQ